MKRGESMIRICICDDDMQINETLRKVIEQYTNSNGINSEVLCASCGEEIFDIVEYSGYIDILFLDIEMTGMNGINTAVKLRKMNYATVIIFMSSHNQYYK